MKKLFWAAAVTLTIVGMLVSVTYQSNAQGRDTRSRPVDGGRDRDGNIHAGGAGSRPLDNQSGNLDGTFWFELYTCNRGSATVTFVGNLIQATGSVGDTSFTKTITGTVLNPQNKTKSLVGVYVKVRSFSGLLGV